MIQKWLSDGLNEKEQELFDALPEAGLYKRVVEDAKAFRASNVIEVKSFEHFKDELKGRQKKSKLRWLQPALRLTGVFLLGMALFYSFFYNPLQHIEADFGEKISFYLPDQSQVTLNAGSEISFQKKNWKSKRVLNLSGEAFFDVMKGEAFTVKTALGEVRVLGTEFNIIQRALYFEIQCYEGQVQVVTPNEELILTEGQGIRFYQGKKMNLSQADDSKPQWLDNRSTFSRIPLVEVFAEMERQYGIQIELIDVDEQTLFTGSFAHDKLEGALQAIAIPMNLKTEIINLKTVRVSPGEH